LTTIAIIGAGVSGLTLAKFLTEHSSHTVTVFEKSKRVGGRIATHVREGFQFDMGAQYFTARNPIFIQFINELLAINKVAIWDGAFLTVNQDLQTTPSAASVTRYIGTPKMDSMCEHLSSDLDIRFNTEIRPIEPVLIDQQSCCLLHDTQGNEIGIFDWVISTAPAAQSLALLPKSLLDYHRIEQVNMQSCFTTMLGFNEQLTLPTWQNARLKHPIIKRISLDNSKPGRDHAKTTVVIQSVNQWSTLNIDQSIDEIEKTIMDAANHFLPFELSKADYIRTHRWRYANCEGNLGEPFILDAKLQMGVCADWCLASRVEDAYLSGLELGKNLLSIIDG
jgi:renalase